MRTAKTRKRFITCVHVLVADRQPTSGIRWCSVYVHHEKSVDVYHATPSSYRRLLRVLLAEAAAYGNDEWQRAVLQYIAEQTEYLTRLIYHHQCNIPEPNFEEQQEYGEAWGEREALQKVKGMLEATEQKAMRDRSEVEERLHNLVGLLAHSDLVDDSTVRVHARALDLVWVLYPALAFSDSYRYLHDLITRRKSEE